jgi:ABC-type thiamine transport system substrate-binding protein
MMAGQRRVRKIVETKLAIVAKIALAMRLSVVTAVAHDMFAAALGTANALRPAFDAQVRNISRHRAAPTN